MNPFQIYKFNVQNCFQSLFSLSIFTKEDVFFNEVLSLPLTI